MENKKLRNIFIAAGLAVFAGVLTLGVNAAFGLDAPSQDPSVAALHSPVFNGVDVQGEIKNTIAPAALDQPVKINDALEVAYNAAVNGNLTTKGDFYVGNPSDPSSLRNITLVGNTLIKGLVTANAGLSVYGVITNPAIVPATPSIPSHPAPVVVDDDLEVNGDSSLAGSLLVKNGMEVNGGASLKGIIMFTGGIEMYSGGIKATGLSPLSLNSVVNLTQGALVPNGKTMTMDGVLAVGANGSIQLPSINGQIKNTDGNPILQTWWNNTFGDYTALNSGYAWTGDATHPNEPVSVVAAANGVFFTKGINGTAYVSTLGKIDTNGKLTTTGGFGTINSYSSVTTINASTKSGSLSQACNIGEKLLSCGINASGWGYVNSLYPNGSACYAYFNNTDALSKSVTVYARCLDTTQ